MVTYLSRSKPPRAYHRGASHGSGREIYREHVYCDPTDVGDPVQFGSDVVKMLGPDISPGIEETGQRAGHWVETGNVRPFAELHRLQQRGRFWKIGTVVLPGDDVIHNVSQRARNLRNSTILTPTLTPTRGTAADKLLERECDHD